MAVMRRRITRRIQSRNGRSTGLVRHEVAIAVRSGPRRRASPVCGFFGVDTKTISHSTVEDPATGRPRTVGATVNAWIWPATWR